MGKIPKGWNVGELQDIGNITSGKRPKNVSKIRDNMYNIPIIGASGFMGFTKTNYYENPIIVTGRVGTIGIVQHVFEKCYPSDNTLVILPMNLFFNYIFHILNNLDYESIKGGSTQPLITQTDLKKIKCIIPEKNILKKFDIVSGQFIILIELNKQQINYLQKIRDTLLPKLMSGEIRV